MNAQNNNGNGRNYSWTQIREAIWIIIIIVGAWWGTVYSPIQDKFTIQREQDIAQNKKFDEISAELRQRSTIFSTQDQLKQAKEELDRRIEKLSNEHQKIVDTYVSQKLFDEHRTNDKHELEKIEKEAMTRREFQAWKEERDQVIKIINDRLNRLSERLTTLQDGVNGDTKNKNHPQ